MASAETLSRQTVQVDSVPAIGEARRVKVENYDYVLVDEESYENLLDQAEEARFIAAVKEGFDAIDRGEVVPLEEAFAQIRKRRGL
ncbi:hypothetical protein BH11ARM2_BH11ARM2_09630 [soil metagenome]